MFASQLSPIPIEALQSAASQVMQIAEGSHKEDKDNLVIVRFRGRLVIEPETAYRLIAEKFRGLGYTALFRKEGADDVIIGINRINTPSPSRIWINLAMLGLTAVSVFWTGTIYANKGEIPTGPAQWLAGWPYLLCLLGILLAHEMGHYLVARHHGVTVTLPYFIPLPLPFSPFGTMGAFIQLKSVPPNRRALMDIGIAGPLCGLAIALPVLVYGLLTSPVETIPLNQTSGFEGNSILYVALKYLIFGRLLPEPATYGGLPPLIYMLRFYLLGFPPPAGGQDVTLNQIAWAGWAGLLVTGINLIPAGQLDGGHVIYALLGERARKLQPFILATLIGLGFFWPGWFLMAGLLYVFGRVYAEPLDQITDLDGRRQIIGVLMMVLFVLIATPIPLK